MAARRWVRPTEALAIGLSACLLFSCTSDTSPERTATTSAALNSSPGIGNFVLYGERSVKLGSFDLVDGGDVGVAATTIASFGDQLVVGDHAQITGTNNLLAPSVTLGSKCQVGDVQTNTLHNDGATSLGMVASYPAPSMPPAPIAGKPTVSASDVTVGSQAVTTLQPGAYGALAVGDHASVTLSAGTYSFTSVSINDHAQITSDAAGATLLVSGSLSVGEWDQIAPASGATADKLVVLVGGTDAAGGASPTATIGIHAQTTALMAVPHGTLAIADHAQLTGAFTAFDVVMADHTQVTFQVGFTPSSPGQLGSQALAGYVPFVVRSGTAPLVAPVPPDMPVLLAIGLPIPRLADLESFIQNTTDPTSSMYRQHMSDGDFNNNYGASQHDYSNVYAFALSSGFTIDETFPDNLILTVTAPAGLIEQALYTNLNYYQRADGSQFFSVAVDPSVDLGTTLLWISGLNNYVISQPGGGSGPGDSSGPGDYIGYDLRNAYLGPVGSSPCQSLFGQGITIGLYEEAGFTDPASLNAYISEAQKASPGLTYSDSTHVYLAYNYGHSNDTTTGVSEDRPDVGGMTC